MDYDELSGYGEEIVPTEYFEEVGYDDDEALVGEDDDYDDESVGDEVDELLAALSGYADEIGARRRKKKAKKKKRKLVRKVVQPKASQMMRQLRATQARRYPLGLGITSVGAGATAIIAVNPQLPFKLLRLSTAITGFTIDNIQIGTTSQFVAAGAIPSEVFAPNAMGVDLKGDTAIPGVQIQITVTNTGAAAANFTGALFGLVAQYT